MDYFSAALGISYSLFLAAVRIWHLYPTAARPTPTPAFKRLALVTAGVYTCHVVYLSSLERFDCASLPPRGPCLAACAELNFSSSRSAVR